MNQAKHRRRMEKKLGEARGEIEDLTNEFYRERQGLLESIRAQNRELKLLEQVLSMMLPSKEISKVSRAWLFDSVLLLLLLLEK